MSPHEPAAEQPEDWDDDVLDDLLADEDHLHDDGGIDDEGRVPRNYGEVAYSGIIEGEVDGMWLLSYWMPEEDLEIKVAVFDSREAALEMAAQIDELTETDHFWCVDTVFLNPPDAGDVIAAIEGGEEEVET